MIDSFDRSEFLGFFCEDGRTFLGQLREGLDGLAAGFDAEAYERCTRAAHSLTGTAKMMSLGRLGGLFASAEHLLELLPAHAGGAVAPFAATRRLVDLLEEGLVAVCERGGDDASADLCARWDAAVEAELPWAHALLKQGRRDAALPGAGDDGAGEHPAPPAAGAEELTSASIRAELRAGARDLGSLFLEELAAARRELKSATRDLAAGDPPAEAGRVARRLVHTFVGSASMVGLEGTSARLRALEAELDASLAAGAAPGGALLGRVRAALGALLAVATDGRDGRDQPAEAAPAPAPAAPRLEGPVDEETLRDFDAEAAELLESLETLLLRVEEGADPLPLADSALRAAHTLKGIAQTVGRDALSDAAHRFEEELGQLARDPARAPALAASALPTVDLMRRLAAGDAAPRGPARPGAGEGAPGEPPDADGPVADTLRVSSLRLDRLMDLVGELVISRTRMASQLSRLAELRRALRGSQDRLVTMVESFRRRYEFQDMAGRPLGGPAVDLGFSGLEFDRYDDMNVLSRSLIEVSADTSEVMRELHALFGGFGTETESLQRITSTLQADVSSIRMVPVSRLFQRLVRPLRDAARAEGKDVRVETSGGGTEVDRAVLDGLYGALVHVVRNAVAHGIEVPEARRAWGKAATGRVTLRAFQEGGLVGIEVSDDGRGIDEEEVRDAAGRLGVEAPGGDVRQLVFLPGVSTRRAAGALAGRGVGLGAVREAVERLGGQVELASSPGAGTTVTVRVPTTLTIHQALVVETRGESFAIPLSVVDEVTSVDLQSLEETRRGPVLLLRGEPIPVRDLAALLDVPGSDAGGEKAAVVVRASGKREVLVVDRVAARQEIVLKSLGRHLRDHPFVQGASLLGDGSVLLVLDVSRLLSRRSAAPLARPAAAPAPRQAPGARPAVLVVDDSLSVRRVAERLLADLGAQSYLAGDGVEALEVLRTHRVDLVLTDLEMPRLNGYELIAGIRRNPELATLPVVVISSRGSEKHRAHAESLGASGYVTKPFTRQDLAAWLTPSGAS